MAGGFRAFETVKDQSFVARPLYPWCGRKCQRATSCDR